MKRHRPKSKFVSSGKRFLAFYFGLFVIFCIVSFYFAFDLFFASRVYANVYFGGVNLGGSSREQTLQVVKRELDLFKQSKVSFMVQDKEIDSSLADLGIAFDEEATTNNIYTIGKGGKGTLADKLRIIAKGKRVKSVYNIDPDTLNTQIEKLFGDFEKMPVNASIIYADGKATVEKEQNGKVLDKSLLISSLISKLDYLSGNSIETVILEDRADVSEGQLKKSFEAVSNLANSQITLSYSFDKWTLAPGDLIGFLKIYPKGQSSANIAEVDLGASTFFVKRVYFDKRVIDEADLSFDNEKFNNFLDSIAKVIDKETRDATLKFENGKVVEFSSAQDGQILDREQTRKLILKNISLTSGEKKAKIAIELPVLVTKARIANDQINSMGIKEIVGRGVSYFAGSIPNRVSNVALGATLINGALIKSGDVFSFDALVGPVSAAQGFKQAYVINQGRTVLDDGGGICQVSTTVFRAALNAGLPIVKRTAHAYRVHYYEEHGFKPGFDATIFSPSVDLQFKNDTDHYLLVQTSVDRANSRIEVDIYGTSDGRRVEISDPVVSNITPAPEPKYQDDPTIPKGVTKQVDFAAAGATSVFTRKVKKGNQVIIDESFKSNYRPWQAVFLVGQG